VLYPDAKERLIDIGRRAAYFKAKRQEPALLRPTSTSKTTVADYNAYAIDGDVTGPPVVCEFTGGRPPKDYEELERR